MKVREIIPVTLSKRKMLFNKQASASYQFFIYYEKMVKKYHVISIISWDELLLWPSRHVYSSSLTMAGTLAHVKLSNDEKQKYQYLFNKMITAKEKYEYTGIKTKEDPQNKWITIYDET